MSKTVCHSDTERLLPLRTATPETWGKRRGCLTSQEARFTFNRCDNLQVKDLMRVFFNFDL